MLESETTPLLSTSESQQSQTFSTKEQQSSETSNPIQSKTNDPKTAQESLEKLTQTSIESHPVMTIKYSEENIEFLAIELYKKLQNFMEDFSGNANPDPDAQKSAKRQPTIKVTSKETNQVFEQPLYLIIPNDSEHIEYPNPCRDGGYCIYGPGTYGFYLTNKPDSVYNAIMHGKMCLPQQLDPGYIPKNVNQQLTVYRVANAEDVYQKVGLPLSVQSHKEDVCVNGRNQEVTHDEQTNCIIFHPQIGDPERVLDNLIGFFDAENRVKLEIETEHTELIHHKLVDFRANYDGYKACKEECNRMANELRDLIGKDQIPLFLFEDYSVKSLELVKIGLNRVEKESQIEIPTEDSKEMKEVIQKLGLEGSSVGDQRKELVRQIEDIELLVRLVIQMLRKLTPKTDRLSKELPQQLVKLGSIRLFLKHDFRNDINIDFRPILEPIFIFSLVKHNGPVTFSFDAYNYYKDYKHPGLMKN